MKNILKFIYQLFLTINIFESNGRLGKVRKSKKKIFFVKSLNELKNKKYLEKYFEENEFKLNRLKNKSKFMGLRNKSEVVCSGWIYFGKNWKIEEINKIIKLNKRYLLYDFITEKKFRNKGYYKFLLKIIQNKFKKKKLIIYSLSHNTKSIKAIKNSGFKHINSLKKY